MLENLLSSAIEMSPNVELNAITTITCVDGYLSTLALIFGKASAAQTFVKITALDVT
jgi:hypothetical protein